MKIMVLVSTYLILGMLFHFLLYAYDEIIPGTIRSRVTLADVAVIAFMAIAGVPLAFLFFGLTVRSRLIRKFRREPESLIR